MCDSGITNFPIRPSILFLTVGDLVLAAFRTKQKQYQALLQGLQNIAVPLEGDDAAIKKYAQEVEALKKKVGMADYEDVLSANINYSFACAGYDVRKFVGTIFNDLKLSSPDSEAVAQELAAAVEEAEKTSGSKLNAGNNKGWSILSQKINEIEQKHGLGDKAKVRDEAVFNMYQQHVASLREAVEAEVEQAGASGSLPKPSLKKLKPKLV
jgi:hypothetical protein